MHHVAPMRGRYFKKHQKYICIHDLSRLVFPTKDTEVRTLVTDYCPDNLPVIIKVIAGYCGANAVDFTFGSDEKYLVTHLNTQPRMILKDRTGQLLSFPADHKLKFHILTGGRKGKDSVAKTLHEILEDNSMSEDRLQLMPDGDAAIDFYAGPGYTFTMKMDWYEFETAYEERYFVGNSIDSERLSVSSTVIPLWMPISVVVANGIKDELPGEFEKFMKSLVTMSSPFGNESTKGYKDIMLFQGRISDYEGVYDTIEPSSYYNFKEAEDKSKRDVYSEVDLDYSSGKELRHLPPPPSSSKRINQPVPNPPKPDLVEESEGLYEGIDDVPASTSGSNDEADTAGYSRTKSILAVTPNKIKKASIGSKPREGTPLPGISLTNKAVQHLKDRLKPMDQKRGGDKQKETVHPIAYIPKTTLTPASRHKDKASRNITGEENSPGSKKPHMMKTQLSQETSSPLLKDSSGQRNPPEVAPKPKIERQSSKPDSSEGFGEKGTEEPSVTDGNPYGSYAELPKLTKNMSVEDVADCLKVLNMQRHMERFLDEAIDGELLMSLDEAMLVQEFDFKPFEARKMAMFKTGWRPSGRKEKSSSQL